MAKTVKQNKKVEVVFNNNLETLQQVLLKKAVGYKTKETVEEFGMVEGDLTLLKKKVSVKHYPPDLTAIQLLLNSNNKTFEISNYTDEELELEKQRLVKQLNLISDISDEAKQNNENKEEENGT